MPYFFHFIALHTADSFHYINGGGLLGDLIATVMTPVFNNAGTLIITTVVFLLSVVMLFNFSLLAFCKNSLRLIVRLFYLLQRRWEILRRHNNKKQQVVEPAVNIKPSTNPSPPSSTPPPQERFDFYYASGSYLLPDLRLLDAVPKRDERVKKDLLIMNSKILETKLADFDVEAKVTEVRPGPVVTTYEVQLASGVKISKITALNSDLGLALRAASIRIAPIAGKGTIGIEIPNQSREMVCLKSLLESEAFTGSSSKLSIALGADIVGMPIVSNLEKMPHLLIAGTTGSGKSVALNAMICSILYKSTPDEVKFLMIDPKRIELSFYEGIPHLLHPVVVDPKEAASVLRWAVEEMERRYTVIGDAGVRSIESYNKGVLNSKTLDKLSLDDANKASILPYIVIVLDELADLMMVAQRNVETFLARLAQKARAAGIHIIVATQRPSVDVITGVIKANFPTRISFHVSSKVDSRTVLDQQGAEDLLGAGDMLFMSSGSVELRRIHGAFVSEKEIERVVEHIKKQRAPVYDTSISEKVATPLEAEEERKDTDEHYQNALAIVQQRGEISISFLQRQLNIGYNRAAKLVERMENEGIVGPADGSKMRKVIRR